MGGRLGGIKSPRKIGANRKFEQIIKMANEGIWTLDADGNTDFINDLGAAILGYRPDEMIGRPVTDFAFPEHREEFEKMPGKSRRAEVERYEVRARRKDGSEVWVLSSTSPLLGDDGSYQGALAMFNDISERKRAEEESRREHRQLLSIFDSMDEPVYVADPHTYEFLYINDAFRRFWGELVGQKCYTIQNRSAPCPFCTNKYIFGDNLGQTYIWEFQNERNCKWYRCIDRAIQWPDGRNVRFELAIDITDSKRAEESLKESEAKYRSLFANIAETVAIWRYVWDDEHHLVDARLQDANPLALKNIGAKSVEEVRGKLGTELARDNYFEKSIPILCQLQVSTSPMTLEWCYDDRDYLISYIPIDDHLYATTSLDVTEIKRAQRQAVEYSMDLERSNAELQQFAYVVSHDLQEPLRMVTAYLSLLKDRYRDQLDERAKGYMDFAIEGGLRSMELLRDLLDYSRIDADIKSSAPIAMEAAFTTAVTNLHLQIEENSATITHDNLPTIMADELQMVQVLQNLCSNAIKFHRDEPPSIHVSCHDGGKEWTFSVADNGIGVDPRHVDKLFVLFQRLHTNREFKGTGIGLAIVKKIIERHGGRVWLESQFGKGTTFYFTVPKERSR